MNLPEKTVERLSEYRRTLLNCLGQGKSNIYSHEIANLHGITAVQVRRDIMLIGYSTSQKRGYDIKELTGVIGKILDSQTPQNVAVVGIGNLGKAITAYFIGKRSKLNLVAAFDIDQQKINRVIAGIQCYPMQKIEQVIKEKHIEIIILTVPADVAYETTEKIVLTGIKGILNFTTVSLNNLSPDVYLEEYDMITSLEKVAFFCRRK